VVLTSTVGFCGARVGGGQKSFNILVRTWGGNWVDGVFTSTVGFCGARVGGGQKSFTILVRTWGGNWVDGVFGFFFTRLWEPSL